MKNVHLLASTDALVVDDSQVTGHQFCKRKISDAPEESQENILFSRIVPSGIWIRLPSLATKSRVSSYSRNPSLRLTDDNSSRKLDLLADPHVTVDGQVVEFGNVGNRLEALFKVGNLLEGVTELDNGRSLELSRWVLQ